MTTSQGPVRKSQTARTLTAAVVERLRSGILACQFPPGARLRLEALRNEFQVGYSPLREAMMQLVSEGLIELEGQRGFRVAPVSIEDLKDTMETRIAIEALTMRSAVMRGDDTWEANIVASFHRLSKQQPTRGRTHIVNEEWFERHREFHFSLIAAADSELLKKFWMLAYDRAERYRRLAVAYGSTTREVDLEHEALMKAALAHEVENACYLSAEHIRKTLNIILYDIGAKMPIFDSQ